MDHGNMSPPAGSVNMSYPLITTAAGTMHGPRVFPTQFTLSYGDNGVHRCATTTVSIVFSFK